MDHVRCSFSLVIYPMRGEIFTFCTNTMHLWTSASLPFFFRTFAVCRGPAHIPHTDTWFIMLKVTSFLFYFTTIFFFFRFVSFVDLKLKQESLFNYVCSRLSHAPRSIPFHRKLSAHTSIELVQLTNTINFLILFFSLKMFSRCSTARSWSAQFFSYSGATHQRVPSELSYWNAERHFAN